MIQTAKKKKNFKKKTQMVYLFIGESRDSVLVAKFHIV